MSFTIQLLLPSIAEQRPRSSSPARADLDDFVDDNPALPLFLFEACAIFAAVGVRLEINGLFADPLPVSTDTELVYFLEHLPGMLRFLEEASPGAYRLGLWGEGVETEFIFRKSEKGDLIEVRHDSRIKRRMTTDSEELRCCELVGQLTTFVETYHEALRRYAPGLVREPWNQELFAIAERLGTQPGNVSEGRPLA